MRVWATGMALGMAGVLVIAACGSSSSARRADATGGEAGAVTGGGGEPGSSGAPSTGGEPGAGGNPATGGAAGSSATGGAGGAVASGRCPPLCERLIAADCPNTAPDQAECEAWCEFVTSVPECAQAYDGYFDCAEAADIECNDEGEAAAVGCETEVGAGMACAYAGGPDESLQGPCETHCERLEAADCPEAGSLADCVFGCTVFGAEEVGCADLWDTFLGCAETASVSCNLRGEVVVDGCMAQYTVFLLCVWTNASAPAP